MARVTYSSGIHGPFSWLSESFTVHPLLIRPFFHSWPIQQLLGLPFISSTVQVPCPLNAYFEIYKFSMCLLIQLTPSKTPSVLLALL